jgi:3-mercaptopyruvate sulfurtransferase SseA
VAALLICVAVVALAACKANDGADVRATAQQRASATPVSNSTTPPAAPTPQVDDARRITVAELQKALEKGEAVVVDVRNEQSYKAGHIKGARWIMETDIAARSGELPRDKMIVTYCA